MNSAGAGLLDELRSPKDRHPPIGEVRGIDPMMEVAKILSIPSDVSQVAMLPVGYYTGADFRRAHRPAAAERIHWDTWCSGSG